MNWDFAHFHFIRPWWLLAIPFLVGLWCVLNRALRSTHWESYLSPHVLDALRINQSKQSTRWHWLLLATWIMLSVAAAGPAWQKQAVPSYQNKSAMVIVLDLSISMLSEDLSPNRLTQAKYKLIDILRLRQDGQTALVAYSGDAYTVTPLTDDPKSIEALLPALHPNIMPVQGSNTEAAISLAAQLLEDTGLNAGDILLITDGITDPAQTAILANLGRSFTLSILGVGKTEASPIPLEGGGFLKRSSGEIVLTALNNPQLAQLARQAGGKYSQLSTHDNDITHLLTDDFKADVKSTSLSPTQDSTQYDSWSDMGHWLILLLLPLVALCFRKGVLYILPLGLYLPPDANAFEWPDLWLTQDQQAHQLLESNPEGAAQKFERNDWSGVANYRAKNYSAAAEKFATQNDASGHYNRGNALAMNGQLENAISAYQQALDLHPNHENARHNQQVIEALLKQQEQQEQQEQQDDNSESESQSSDSEQSSDSAQDTSSSENQSSQESSENQSQQQSEQNAEQSQGSESSSNEEDPSERAQQAEDSQQAEQMTDDASEHASNEEQASTGEEPMSTELSNATPDQLEESSEQWLRGIKEDPSGLLRRKFEYQSWLKSKEQSPANPAPQQPNEDRY